MKPGIVMSRVDDVVRGHWLTAGKPEIRGVTSTLANDDLFRADSLNSRSGFTVEQTHIRSGYTVAPRWFKRGCPDSGSPWLVIQVKSGHKRVIRERGSHCRPGIVKSRNRPVVVVRQPVTVISRATPARIQQVHVRDYDDSLIGERLYACLVNLEWRSARKTGISRDKRAGYRSFVIDHALSESHASGIETPSR